MLRHKKYLSECKNINFLMGTFAIIVYKQSLKIPQNIKTQNLSRL